MDTIKNVNPIPRPAPEDETPTCPEKFILALSHETVKEVYDSLAKTYVTSSDMREIISEMREYLDSFPRGKVV